MIGWFVTAIIAAVAAAICLTSDPTPGSHARFLAGICVMVGSVALVGGFVVALK